MRSVSRVVQYHVVINNFHHWVKTDCGRAKLAELQQRTGPANRVRLAWFILIASLRDWRLPNPDHSDVSPS
jgi:hypothetical protein